MYLSRRLRRFGALGNGPRTDLLRSRRQVAYQTEKRISGFDKAVKSALRNSHSAEKFRFFLGCKLRDLRLKPGTDGDDLASVRKRDLLYGLVIAVIRRNLRSFVLGHVGNVYNRLHGDQVEIPHDFPVGVGKFKRACTLAVGKCGHDSLIKLKLRCQRFISLEHLFHFVDTSLEVLHIREYKLHVYGFEISCGIDASLDVDNIVVVEAAQNMDHRIDIADMRKKFISESFAFGCAAHQPRNIDEFYNRRGIQFGRIHFGKSIEPLIGNRDDSHVRFYGAERVIRRLCSGARKRIEKRTFSYVWKTYYTEFHRQQPFFSEMPQL